MEDYNDGSSPLTNCTAREAFNKEVTFRHDQKPVMTMNESTPVIENNFTLNDNDPKEEKQTHLSPSQPQASSVPQLNPFIYQNMDFNLQLGVKINNCKNMQYRNRNVDRDLSHFKQLLRLQRRNVGTIVKNKLNNELVYMQQIDRLNSEQA